jgi:hypothetical protein
MNSKFFRSLLSVLFLIGMGITSSSYALMYQVTNANDSGPGSLRQAILDANSTPGLDSITFTGDFTIYPTSLLPAITDSISIDGSGHTVEINGSVYISTNHITCSCQNVGDPSHPALVLNGASGSSVSNIKITNFCDGILVKDTNNSTWTQNSFAANLGNAQLDFFNSNNNKVYKNLFYQDPSLPYGACSGDHVELSASSNNFFSENTYIGGENAYELLNASNNNIIMKNDIKNSFRGAIEINGGSDNKIIDNIIKDSMIDPDSTFAPLGDGIHVLARVGSSNNLIQGNSISGIPSGNGIAVYSLLSNAAIHNNNIIKDNKIENVSMAGVFIGEGNKNLISRNTIKDADGIGIDLSDKLVPFLFGIFTIGSPDGVTNNNSGLVANSGQNYPVIDESASRWNRNLVLLKGILEVPSAAPSDKYTIECFGNASNVREANVFLGSKDIYTTGGGYANITMPISIDDPLGNGENDMYVSCTATDKNNNTSELSMPIHLTHR